jgi:hypothetical protein
VQIDELGQLDGLRGLASIALRPASGFNLIETY